MSQFPVSAEKERALHERMNAVGMREEDLNEWFVRSQGRGGQHVNKVSTCVYIKHIPTGLEVKCSEGRSQGLNRYRARKILVEKLETFLLGKASPASLKAQKIKKQKLRRKRRSVRRVQEGIVEGGHANG